MFKERKRLVWVLFFLTLAGAASLALGWGRLQHYLRRQRFISDQERQVSADLEVIEQSLEGKLEPRQVEALFSALVRLGRQIPGGVSGEKGRNEKVREELREKVVSRFAASSNPRVRAGAAHFLGCSARDAALSESLKALLFDEESEVRLNALRGVSCVQAPNRRDWLLVFLSGTRVSILEKVEATAELYRLSDVSTGRPAYLRQLLTWAQGEELSKLESSSPRGRFPRVNRERETQDWGVQVAATSQLMRVAWQESTVVDHLRDRLKTGRFGLESAKYQPVTGHDPFQVIYPTLIRNLAARRDSWFVEQLPRWIEAGPATWHPTIAQAVLDGIGLTCPLERWSLLDRWLQKEKNPTLRLAILSAPVLMPGAEALALLSRWSENLAAKKYSGSSPKEKGQETDSSHSSHWSHWSEEQKAVQDAITQVKEAQASGVSDPCLARR